jgi:CubicO group peptidase (beta-lactamase class C family)
VFELSEKMTADRGLAAKFDDYLSRIAPFGFSGAFLAAKDKKVLFNKGYGLAVREKNIANTVDTVFCVGSITKQFTAAAIMTLEMQGKLKTEHSITEYFSNAQKDKQQITLHHLLTHTAGVVNYVGDDYVIAYRDETVKKALDAPLLFQPGSSYEYSNVGYSLLGAIVEIVSGESYEEYLHEHLFKPAGMFFTGYRMPKWQERTVATWYVGEKSFRLSLDAHDQPHWNVIGNGEILSTTNDMHKWYLALKGTKILSAEAKRKLFTPFLNNYAYGWNISDGEHGKIIQHDGGSDLGSSALFTWYVDQDIVTVMFCNQSYGENTLNSVLRGKMERLLFGKKVELPPIAHETPLSNLKRLEGTYTLPTGGKILIRIDYGYLTLTAIGQDAASTVFSLSNKDIAQLNELVDRALKTVNALLKGDFEQGKKELNNEERLKGWQRWFFNQLDITQNKAEQVETTILGGLTWPRSEDTKEIAMKATHDKHEVKFGLLWRNGKLWGLTTGPDTFTMRVLAVSKTMYAGYDLGTAKNAKLSFNTDKQGKITGLAVHTKTGEVKTTKADNSISLLTA